MRCSAKRYAAPVLLLLAVLQLGCVRRRMTVRSNPPGAVVYVDNRRIGVTPVSTAFTYYGTRRVQLVKDGYESVTKDHKFTTPWYQWIGLDFVAENLWPIETRDERILDFQLSPQQSIPPTKILARAEQLRTSAQQDLLTQPLPAPKQPEQASLLQPIKNHIHALQQRLHPSRPIGQ